MTPLGTSCCVQFNWSLKGKDVKSQSLSVIHMIYDYIASAHMQRGAITVLRKKFTAEYT